MKRHLTMAVLTAAVGLAGQAKAQFTTTILSENFNGLVRQTSVNERLGLSFGTAVATDPKFDPIPSAFTHTGPAGWVVDNNYDNFNTADGIADLPNNGGTPVFDTTKPNPPGTLLYKLGQPTVVVGNQGVPNAGDPANGSDEWEGWSFANKTFWSDVSGDQNRSQFTKAVGTIAVVDADEYDDLGTGLGGGYYNSGLTTAPVPTNGLATVKLAFDSSWRAESYDDDHTVLGYPGNNQSAMVWATFDNGQRDLLVDSLWDSDEGHVSSGATDPVPGRPASPFFHADATNESVGYDVSVPAGATSVKFTFGYINAGNDWWWGLDNLAVSDGTNAPYWNEGFESVTLGASVNERISNTPVHVTRASATPRTTPVPDSFTHTPPTGWNVDNSGIPAAGLGDNDVGSFDLEGWTFTTKDFWKFAGQTAGDVDKFTKADGNVALADSDEYDDLNGGGGKTQPMDTVLSTNPLNIAGIAPGDLMLKLDSAWEVEGDQTAIITVDYGSGAQEVLHWDSSSSSPMFHDTNFNETVLIPLNNPAGATTATVSFKYLHAGNNWFWAFDNLAIGAGPVPEPASIMLSCVAVGGLAAVRRRS